MEQTRWESAPAEAATLKASGVTVHFSGIRAVDGVDLTIRLGSIIGLIGPNGAGKTTFINAVTGFQRLTAGEVLLCGTQVTNWDPDRLARAGIARSFQGMRPFVGLTVLENVEIGALCRGGGRRKAQATAAELVSRIGLAHRRNEEAAALPHGDQRRLGIARALAANPRFLLLDEPAAGLAEDETDELSKFIASIPAQFGCGVLIVEHDMRLIMSICERIHVLNYGRTISEGTPEEVRADRRVIDAYLGSFAEVVGA